MSVFHDLKGANDPGRGNGIAHIAWEVLEFYYEFGRMVLWAGAVAVGALVLLIFFPGKDHDKVLGQVG